MVTTTNLQTSDIRRNLVGNKLVDHSALHQLHLHSRLNNWHQWIGQRQCKTRRETFEIWDVLPPKVEVWRYMEYGSTLRPRQSCRHFADDIFKCIFLNENFRISNKISLKFVPRGPISNIQAFVQLIAWRRPGDKPLSEPIVVRSLTHICITRPQWVYGTRELQVFDCIINVQYISQDILTVLLGFVLLWSCHNSWRLLNIWYKFVQCSILSDKSAKCWWI